ncbi:heavy metal-associated domain-containing protein [Jimgerdemannia flammicorona]|uniref:Heavy metal-associated domain-containing protein n=1 Tax=Jimgerdemannia flammicorona TaxID=994334 RepID=A0A433B9V1_9FUNG|nr:heavy metal-associated domain-containing protein [Jimgerdemannia flammicorona]
MADTQTYKFNVGMTCGGCSNAVNRALTKLDGVSKVDISLETQIVEVQATIPQADVLEAIKKTGKPVTPL